MSQIRRASAARFETGRHGRKASGSAHVAMTGTRSTREESAQPAFTNGLQRSASLAAFAVVWEVIDGSE